VKIRELLEGLPIRRSAKIIDGEHPAGAHEQANGDALKPDMLPLEGEQDGRYAHCKRNILVAISGCELDRELMTLAGKVAREKKSEVFVVFGIEVPRTKAIDDEMPQETERAHRALDHVQAVAEHMSLDIEPEIIQSRHFGHSLVDEAEAHECALLIIGLPYRLTLGDEIEGFETLEYVLRNAPCKVWIVRGQPSDRTDKIDKPDRTNEAEQVERERSAVAR
jgi:nucleotide-binding universal stress UspA family protein